MSRIATDPLEISSESVRGSLHPYEDRVLVDEKRGLFAVADGVTGSSQGSGGVAAEIALELLEREFAGDLVSAVQRVHRSVVRMRLDDRSIGETTITAAAIEGNRLQLANLGDSPAYLVRNGVMTSLVTEDISSDGHITQVIGYPEIVNIHAQSMRLASGDVLILATDGVEHVLHPSFIVALARSSSSNLIAEKIVNEARSVASNYDDDKSVIVLRISGKSTT